MPRMKMSMVAALLVALASVGCGSDGEPATKPQGIPLDLPTSGWEPGDEMMFAQVGGVLQSDERGCLGFAGSSVPPVWPKGFSAYRHGGTVTLYGPDGEVVSREGDTVESGGGQVPAGDSLAGSDCLSNGGEVLAVQGEVRVAGD